MKLGSETGSLVNHLLSRATIGQPAPVAGMGVTYLSWTDRSPGTVFRGWTRGAYRYIETRADDYQRTDKNGMSEDQEYAFTVRVNGARSFFRQRVSEPNSEWVKCRQNENGRWVNSRGCGLRIGSRGAYSDPSF